MDNIPILYDIAIEGKHKQELINWGSTPRWVDTHRELLDSAQQISLIPKESVLGMPIVIANLDNGKRWVLFSRVYGQATSGKQLRIYAIGWQQTIKGLNIKSIQWVYPGGTVENAEEPGFIDSLFKGA